MPAQHSVGYNVQIWNSNKMVGRCQTHPIKKGGSVGQWGIWVELVYSIYEMT